MEVGGVRVIPDADPAPVDVTRPVPRACILSLVSSAHLTDGGSSASAVFYRWPAEGAGAGGGAATTGAPSRSAGSQPGADGVRARVRREAGAQQGSVVHVGAGSGAGKGGGGGCGGGGCGAAGCGCRDSSCREGGAGDGVNDAGGGAQVDVRLQPVYLPGVRQVVRAGVQQAHAREAGRAERVGAALPLQGAMPVHGCRRLMPAPDAGALVGIVSGGSVYVRRAACN